MRRLAFLLLVPLTMRAQAPRLEESFALSAGFRSFSPRLERPAASFKYVKAFELELRAEKPLSRRFGWMLAANLVPHTSQRGDSADLVQVAGDVTILGADAAISFRFKPQAPIYFYGGAAVKHFTRFADALLPKKGTTEPGLVAAMGFDKGAFGRYNMRFQASMHFIRPNDPPPLRPRNPNDPEPPRGPHKATSIGRDWGVSIGIRQRAPRQAPPS